MASMIDVQTISETPPEQGRLVRLRNWLYRHAEAVAAAAGTGPAGSKVIGFPADFKFSELVRRLAQQDLSGTRMAKPLADQVLQKINEAGKLYHRLILVVGPSGSGKTRALRDVAASSTAPLVNVNLELSRRMLDLTGRQRALQLPRLLGEIVKGASK